MQFRLLLYFVVASCGIARSSEPRDLSFDVADTRLRRAYGLAREANDSDLVDKVREYRDAVRRSLDRKDFVAAERLLRDAEAAVGLDRGGRAMLGLSVAQIDPTAEKKIDRILARLTEALAKEDVAAVRAIVAEYAQVLGEQAGLPDVRRKGDSDKPTPIKSKDVAESFIKVIGSDPWALKLMMSGNPSADVLPRTYASVVQGCLIIRPALVELQRDNVPLIDELIAGCCKSLLALQLEAGFFRFPDLRGKHMRFGDMIDRLVELDADAIKDGWVVVPESGGSSQYDAGECGLALLRAGSAFKNDAWTKAGLRTAEWLLSAPAVAEFFYNAFSVSVLCQAYKATGNRKFLAGAWKKYQIGVGPGQTHNGRWLDSHSARTVYHLILLRSLHDLVESLPDGRDRNDVSSAARNAVQAIIVEAARLGAPATPHTIQELARHVRLVKEAPKEVRTYLEIAASAAVQRCTAGGRVRAATPLPELAAASLVWSN